MTNDLQIVYKRHKVIQAIQIGVTNLHRVY